MQKLYIANICFGDWVGHFRIEIFKQPDLCYIFCWVYLFYLSQLHAIIIIFFFVFIVLIEWQKIYAVCFGFALLTVDKLFQDLTFVSGYNVIFWITWANPLSLQVHPVWESLVLYEEEAES